LRTAIYARYSSVNQREASIADQVEVCTRYVDKQGWAIVGTYTDRAGRKAGLTLSIGLMLIGTALMVVTPGYATIGIAAPKGRLSPAAEKFWQCAKEAVSAKRSVYVA